MRVVRVKQARTDNQSEHQVNAKTFGELKSELSSLINFTGCRVLCRENRTTLEDDGAELPSDDFTIILTPVNVKSGN